MSRFDTLSGWLGWLEQLHPKSIDLGLERVYKVAVRLNLLKQVSGISHEFSGQLKSHNEGGVSVVTVAGTNGKGSCIATLEKSLLLTKYPEKKSPHLKNTFHIVGSYTSPHLHHYCERIRIDGEPVSETLVCDAFTAVDQARETISLTYFEFGTLAALWIFVQKRVSYALLEVGLGGRLDAVNIVDANIAVVTSIDIDHQEWLGNDRDVISQEKLGISRSAIPLVIAESNLTPSLKQASKRKNTLLIDRDFSFESLSQNQWHFRLASFNTVLPLPMLSLSSVAAALVVLKELNQFPTQKNLVLLMHQLLLPGRFEQVKLDSVEVVYDVAHNPAAAKTLAKRLSYLASPQSKTYAVLALMEDKDHFSIMESMLSLVDGWFLGGLPSIPRAAKVENISKSLFLMLKNSNSSAGITCKPMVEDAFNSALAVANSHDRIVVFGSFYTVAAVQAFVKEKFAPKTGNSTH